MPKLIIATVPGFCVVGYAACASAQPRDSSLNYGVLVGQNLLAFQQGKGTPFGWYWGDLGEPKVSAFASVMAKHQANRTEDDWRFVLTPRGAPRRWGVAFGWFWDLRVSLWWHGPTTVPPIQWRVAFPLARGSEPDRCGAPFPDARTPDLPPGRLAAYRESHPGSGPNWDSARRDELTGYGLSPDRTAKVEDRLQQHWLSFLADLEVDAESAASNRRKEGPSPYYVDVDIIPLARDWGCVLLVLLNDELSVWEIHYELVKEKRFEGRVVPKGEWRIKAVFPSPFSEPFHVAAADGAYFFVTDSGAVYTAEETKGEWKTRPVWKETGRPIIAMLGESESPGGFVFGKDFYFRLGRQVKPKACEDVTKGRPDLADPLRTVFQCGRVLYKSGELKKAEAAK
jgi:hypothetical protein